MAEIKFKGNPVHTQGQLPEVGSSAPDFKLTNTDLGEVTLNQLNGKRVVLNIFPSVDTGICAMSVRRFNELASSMDNTAVVNVSKDLPFAHKRFCGAEGIENVVSTSSFRDPEFSSRYGVDMVDGPLAGLMSRAVVVLDENGNVKYTEQVPDITQEPDYDSALNALK
jgi:thiol peroxidase